MRISDWSSDVCSSDLVDFGHRKAEQRLHLCAQGNALLAAREDAAALRDQLGVIIGPGRARQVEHPLAFFPAFRRIGIGVEEDVAMVERGRSEENTSELQSLMRTSYAVFCLQKKRTHIKVHLQTQLIT